MQLFATFKSRKLCFCQNLTTWDNKGQNPKELEGMSKTSG